MFVRSRNCLSSSNELISLKWATTWMTNGKKHISANNKISHDLTFPAEAKDKLLYLEIFLQQTWITRETLPRMRRKHDQTDQTVANTAPSFLRKGRNDVYWSCSFEKLAQVCSDYHFLGPWPSYWHLLSHSYHTLLPFISCNSNY